MGLDEVKFALVLSKLLSLATLFDLGRVALANEAHDCYQACLKAQQIKICVLEVAIQNCGCKVLGDMVHQLGGHEWAESLDKIIWYFLDDC